MAFGLSPKHIEDLPLDDLTHEQFLVLMIEAAGQLNWDVGYTSENGFIAYTKFSMSSSGEEIKVKIDGNNATIKSECTGNQMVDWGKNKGNIENLISTFNELKTTYTTEELDQKYEELKPTLVSNEEDALNQPPSSTKDKLTGIFAIFKPVEGYTITPILIDLNLAIFAIMVISGVNFMLPDSQSLLMWGANFRPLTLEGEWWRLITSCFLHIGILHLLMNMYALVYIGLLLEPYLGKTRFAAAYLLTGLAASITSLWWHDNVISAGASGAIFGMYGVFLAMLTTDLLEKTTRKALLTSVTIFVSYNLINGIQGGIDNAAHIGGLISGLIIGYAFIPSLKKPDESKLKFGTIGLLTILILVSSFFVCKTIPNDLGTYDARMKEFASMELKALEVYNLPQDYRILSEIKDKGIYYWNKNIKLIDGLNDLDLPPVLQKQNRLLKEYCELRIKSYELLYKAIEEDTDQYEGELESYNKQIEYKINQINGGQQTK